MRKRDPKRLVIDADVAQSSGSDTATDSRAINCRDFLKTMREQNHKVVMTEKISDEWKKHQSSFARRWRLSMDARRKVERIVPPNFNEIQNKITNTTDKDDTSDAMNKDFHLLAAALASDRTVVSLDETVRSLFALTSKQVSEIKNIVWVNPDKTAEEQPISWLKSGAPNEAHRQLFAYPTQ